MLVIKCVSKSFHSSVSHGFAPCHGHVLRYHNRSMTQAREWPTFLRSLRLNREKFTFLNTYSEAGSDSLSWVKKQSGISTERNQAPPYLVRACLLKSQLRIRPAPAGCSLPQFPHLPTLRFNIVLHETLEEGKCEGLRAKPIPPPHYEPFYCNFSLLCFFQWCI